MHDPTFTARHVRSFEVVSPSPNKIYYCEEIRTNCAELSDSGSESEA